MKSKFGAAEDMATPATGPAAPTRAPAARIIFWAAAVLLLFFGLGECAVFGSEDRWAEVSRKMLLTGDFFHPIINDEVYFDKPLLTYWLIAAASFLTRGVNEFTTRLPSALAGLAALWAMRNVARRFWSETVTQGASWILLTCYGFMLWARNAQADMENLAAVVIAVAWFFAHERKPGFVVYAVFYLICVIGAGMKGLTAIVVPILVLMPWLLRAGRWKSHLRVSHLAALLLGCALYLTPFFWSSNHPLPAGYISQRIGLSGLGLVYRENITRFLHPFDHANPIYLYLYELPRLMLPWVPILVGAVIVGLASLKRLDPPTRWLVEAVAVVFLFFSASGSRRGYYILPILPFCAVLMALFVSDWNWERTKRISLSILVGLFLVIAAVYLASPALWQFAERRDFLIPERMRYATFALGVLLLGSWLISRRRPELLTRFTGTDARLGWPCVASALVVGGALCLQQPSFEIFRDRKAFAQRVAELGRTSGDDIVFFQTEHADVVFYIDQPNGLPVFDKGEELHSALVGASRPKLVVTERDSMTKLRSAVPETALGEPVCTELVMPWEAAHDGSKLVAFRIPGLPAKAQ